MAAGAALIAPAAAGAAPAAAGTAPAAAGAAPAAGQLAVAGPAPGGPGVTSYLDAARKDCFGTAAGRGSRVWFTAAGGVLSPAEGGLSGR